MTVDIEPLPQLKKDPVIENVAAARGASRAYEQALEIYNNKASQAKAAGLPSPGNPPELTDQITLGQRLDQVGRDALRQFSQAQEQWVNSGQKDHSALDTAIASLSQIKDPLDLYEAASAAIVQFMDRADFPFSDVLAVAKICPEVLHQPGLISRLTEESGRRVNYREEAGQNYQSQTAFLDAVFANHEYLNPETVTQARLSRGEITGLKIDKLLQSTEKQSRGWEPTIPIQDLIRYLELPDDSGISESQIGNLNPSVWNVPSITARLSRENINPAIKEHLQGVTIGLIKSTLSRRPEHAFRPPETDHWRNLTTAAFNGLANLHDPETFDLGQWANDSTDKSPLHQIVAKMYRDQGNMDEWRKLSIGQSSKVRTNEAKAAVAAKSVADAEAATKKATADAEAARKAEDEKKTRQAIVTSYRQNHDIQTTISTINLGSSPDEVQAAIDKLNQLVSQNPDLAQVVTFAHDVLTQFQQLSSADAGIITRTVETITDKGGILGVGKKTHQETRYRLDESTYNKNLQSARDADKEQIDLSQQAILETLDLIHQRIYPPSNR